MCSSGNSFYIFCRRDSSEFGISDSSSTDQGWRRSTQNSPGCVGMLVDCAPGCQPHDFICSQEIRVSDHRSRGYASSTSCLQRVLTLRLAAAKIAHERLRIGDALKKNGSTFVQRGASDLSACYFDGCAGIRPSTAPNKDDKSRSRNGHHCLVPIRLFA